MTILEHWQFAMYGIFADSYEFKSPDTGEMQRGLRFDTFGNQQSLMIDDEGKFHSLCSLLERGRQARIYGQILFKNGHARTVPLSHEIEGVDAKFKNLTDEEAYYGSMTRGVGEIMKKVYYKNPKGDESYSLEVRATGSPLKMAVLDLLAYPQIPGSGLHLIEGRLKTDIKRNYSRDNGSSEKSIMDLIYVRSQVYQFGGSKTKEPA